MLLTLKRQVLETRRGSRRLGRRDHGRRAVDAMQRPAAFGQHLAKLEIKDAV